MKLLYVTTHQISNLLPLFRELGKTKKINFKVVYWQNLDSNYYDVNFKKFINYGIDTESGYQKFYLSKKLKKTLNFSFIFKFIILFKLIKFLIKEDFDEIVFHSSYLFPHALGAIFCKLLGKTTIARNMSYNIGKRNFLKKKIRFLYYSFFNYFYDKYWSIHKLNENFFLDFGAKKEQINLIHHCQGEFDSLIEANKKLVLSKTDFCEKYDLPLNKNFILFVGIFNKRKNPSLLIDAFIEARLSDDWFLIMVGKGEFEKIIKDKVKINGNTNIKFFDFKNQKELIGFFNNSEILVAPSNFGDSHCNIAAEAIQFGCAIVASNMIGLYPEFIEEEVGLIFDIDNKSELIQKLKKLTLDKEMLLRLQKNAKNYGHKKKPKFTAKQILSTY
tara:strand:+ start:1055 stop:2218 length:1164 start_codon:yes stop_codon:yes gene_type:complete